MMKTESPVSADIDNSRCGGSAKSILSRPFGVVGITRQWMLFYRCFVLVGVLLPVATFGSHQCTHFLSLSIPQGPKSQSKRHMMRFEKSLANKSSLRIAYALHNPIFSASCYATTRQRN
jgi:hypothetical protein